MGFVTVLSRDPVLRTLLRSGEAPVAIPEGERWLLILPTSQNLTPAEDPLRAEDLRSLADDLGERVELVSVSGEPTAEEIAQAARAALSVDGVIVATLGLRESEARRTLVGSALEWHPRTSVVLLGDPGEVGVLPRRDFTAIATYGYREVHRAALARLLRGEIEPQGRWPVPEEVRRAARLAP